MTPNICGDCKFHLKRGVCPRAEYKNGKDNLTACLHSDSACMLFQPKKGKYKRKQQYEDNPDMKYALELLNKHVYKCPTDTKKVLVFCDGIYKDAEPLILEMLENEYQEKLKRNFVEESYAHIQRSNFIDRKQVNRFTNKIPIQNGLFNLLTLEVTPFDSEQIFTYKLNVSYNPNAQCPKWLKFVKQVINKEDIPLLQEIMGYCLLPDMPFHKIFWLYGNGRNGKGVVIRTLEAVIGKENCSSLELHQFFGRFSLQRLYGKFVNISNEPRLTKYGIDTTVIKLITGQDTIDAELKNKNEVLKFVNHAKPIVLGNKFPKVEDNSLGWWDRVETLKFPNSFDGENKIPNIERCWIPEEIDGIFNWMLSGLYRLKKQNGFSKSRTTEETKMEFMKMSDPFYAWIIECCDKIPNTYLVREEALTSYENYCDEIGAERDSKRVFYEKMRKEYKVKDKQKMLNNKNVRVFEGIILKINNESQTSLADLAVLAGTHIPKEFKQNNNGIRKHAKVANTAKNNITSFYYNDGKTPTCFNCKKTIFDYNQLCVFDNQFFCKECKSELVVQRENRNS